MSFRSAAARHGQVFLDFLQIYKFSLLRQYVFVPLGVVLILMILYGVNVLIRDVIGIKFPASVAVMLVNFGSLCVLSAINEPFTEKYIGIIDIPLSWALRWMTLFFTPAFVTLPLSPWISFREAMLIAAFFVFCYIITGFCLAYVTVFAQKLSNLLTGQGSIYLKQKLLARKKEKMMNDTEVAYSSAEEDADNDEEESVLDIYDEDDDIHNFADIFSDPEIEDFQLVNVASNNGFPVEKTFSHRSHTRDVDAPLISRHITSAMAGEDSEQEEGIAQFHGSDRHETGHSIFSALKKPKQLFSRDTGSPEPLLSHAAASSNLQQLHTEKNVGIDCERALTRQFSRRMEHLFTVNMWHDHIHHILYSLGLLATIFTYYFTWYIMPFQLFTAVCMFFIITDAPLLPNPKYKKFLHPIICSVALFWIIQLISSLIKHHEIKYFLYDLKDYKTGISYLYLFSPPENKAPVSSADVTARSKNWPGAGDVLSSCMDVSIVALSMPMYTYRKDLRNHFFAILLPILVLCAVTLIVNPLICYKIGISSFNSLGFVGRSITLALAIPTIENLEGSVTVMAVITVLSGIIGALSGGPMLDFFRISKDDFITRGLTLGCNCGAIATSYLLTVDRRAAAISSLSFVLYGAIMIILTSIGTIKHFIQDLVSL